MFCYFFIAGVSLLLLFLYSYILYPLLRIYGFKKQIKGISKVLFFPMMGFIHYMRKDEGVKEDVFDIFYTENPKTQVFLSNFDTRAHVILVSPEYNKLLSQNENHYRRNPPILMFTEVISKHSLFLSPTWKRQRKLLGPYFHHDRLKGFTGPIGSICDEIMGEHRNKLSTLPEKSQKIKLMQFGSRITGEVVIRFFFSEDLKGRELNGKPISTEVQELLTDIFVEGTRPLNLLKSKVFGIKYFLTRKEKEILTRLDGVKAMALEMMEKRRKAMRESKDTIPSEKGDLLWVYLQEMDKQKGRYVAPEEKITEDEILQNFYLLYFAGVDTTNHLVAMAIYCLAKYPECYEKIEKEMETHGIFSGEMSYEKINSLSFLNAFLKEVLRKYTPAFSTFFRLALEDHKLGDLQIKKDDLVSSNLMSSLMNPSYFPNPKLFDPTRWLSGEDSQIDPFAYMPFFAGPRNCIGQHLSMIEGKIIMLKFVKHFRVKLNPDVELKMSLLFLRSPLHDDLVILENK